MDPLDFLAVANKLYSSSEEAERRTSVGRSYFALFNHVRRKIEPLRPVPTSDEAHRAVVYCLQHANDRDLSSIGQTLTNLRASRNGADYQLDDVVTDRDSGMAISIARKAVAKLDGVGNAALANAVRAVPQIQARRHNPGRG